MEVFAPRPALLFGCCIALSLPALAEGPFSFESAPGRLPKTVVPVSYQIAITPNVDALSLQGTESVVLEFRQPADTVVFNSLNEKLNGVKLDGKAVKSTESDDEKQWTTVRLAKPAAVGRHILTFSYTGKIETQPRGLFAQHYSGLSEGVMLSTQMEATDARRMFPCWDEPAFRATFQLTVTVPSKWRALSNMPVATEVVSHGSLTTTTFQPTPKMPSYLVEFTAGDISSVKASSGGVQFGVWTVRGQEKYGEQALADAQLILQDYNDYFGYAYPLPKLDSIAVPGGFSGAMENWGAITYNDQTLLVKPSSTLGGRQLVFSIEAHEMAHQWNGDLVTMGWWDDLWLNESFASWMAAKETDKRHPEWHWWEGEDGSKENAMSADAYAETHAIRQHVTNELEATNAFDPAITYNKGQAILRMLEAYAGPDAFRSGVRTYIKARAFSNATTTDLWNGLDGASGKKISQIASDWTAQPGFPLIAVAATCDSSGRRSVRLTQSRFLLQGSEQGHSHWSVPLQVRTGTAGTPQSVLLTEDGQTLAGGRCDEPLSLDAEATGFYRVQYDAATLAINTKSFSQLPSGDRIALLDDEWALVGSRKEPLSAYLALVQSMGNDLNVRAWEQIEVGLSTIEFDERGAPDHDKFTAYARSILKPVFDRLGWDPQPAETAEVPKLRRAVLEDLGEWGDPAVAAEARRRLDAYLQTHSGASPDELAAILTIVGRGADAATFEKIHALAKAAKDDTEKQRYYFSLMRVTDESLAEQAARIALSAEIPPQQDSSRLPFIATLAQRHPQLAWKIFCDHTKELLSPHAPFDSLIIAQEVPRVFWSGVPANQLETWIRGHVPEQMHSFVDRGMQTVHYKVAQKEALLSAAGAWKKVS